MQFSYVQIGARDCESLAAFYMEALDFERSEKTEWLRGKEGVALSAPGFNKDNAPVFGIVKAVEGAPGKINDTGFAHICFETTDVKKAVKRLIKHGGSVLSTMKHPENHPCVYCMDPEGNVVEFHIPFPSKGTAGEYLTTAGSLLGLKPNRGKIKFIHVNIITEDWRKLCDFYNRVFESRDFGKIKDHSGSYKEKVISIPGVHVVGQHVLLKGFFESYPTLEIFTYSVKGRSEATDDSALGINCIGFTSENLKADEEKICAGGGKLFAAGNAFVLAGDPQDGRILLKGI